MNFAVKSVDPVYGVNYAEGWSFGSFRDDAIISDGIVWFTRWDRDGQPPVSHVGIVNGPDSVIEAVMGRGVVETPIKAYFDDPHAHIYFRKPRGYDRETGLRIATVAQTQLGAKYDVDLVRAHLLAGTFLGHWLMAFTSEEMQSWIYHKLNSPEAWICSELAAWVMQQNPRYASAGCLKRPACTITPAEYCWNTELFKPFEREE